MSLDLDTRQRAILQEMGIHVWLPEPPAQAPQVELAPEPPPIPRSVTQAPAVAFQATVDAALRPSAVAIETIAIDAINTRATPQKALQTLASESLAVTPGVLAGGIAAMDWPTLADTVASCQACSLCEGRRAPVFGGAAGDAPHQADWLVVGEPPDEFEERAGTPFADQAGELLDNMLKAVGLHRHDAPGATDASSTAQRAYITNVVKCRPAMVRNPTKQELALCENYLRREVALVQPKVILAMGRFAAQTLLHGSLPEGSKLPFGKLRGQIYRYQGIPVIVSYHPTYLLRNQADKARAWADLCLARQVAHPA